MSASPGSEPPEAREAGAAATSALRASESRYRRLFEAAQDGILLVNAATGQIDDANPYVMSLLGYSLDAMRGKKLWEIGAVVDIAHSQAMFERLRHESFIRYSDLPLKTRDGALLSVEFVSNAYDCDGVRVIQCNIRDITAQRAAEAQARTMALVMAQIPLSLAVCRLDGTVEQVNAALLQATGFQTDELVGHHVHQQHAFAGDEPALAAIDAALTAGQVWRGTLRSLRMDGSEFPQSVMAAPICGPDGVVSHQVWITEDITARLRDAAELAQHRHALTALVDSRTSQLVVALAAAQAANIAKSAFLANMSHEIRTPLGAITGLTYLIRRTQVTPQQENWLGKLNAASAHLLALINAVLELSSIEAGKLAMACLPVDPAAITDTVAVILSEQALAKRLVIEVDTQPLPPRLLGDAARLQQALLNYAGNAVKFTVAGRVILRTLCIDESVDSALIRFEVQDTGPGIDAATLARLFVAFEQGDNSATRRHGGTGLGLVIVRQLAHLMGGNAGASSISGVGSIFWLTARLQKERRTPRAIVGPAELSEATLLRDHAHQRVLVVDDDPLNREVALALLEPLFATVDWAADGEAAVRLATGKAYGLIVMDLQMPGVGGLAATRQIRALPGGERAAIVAFTANAFSEDRAACLDAGMDGFLAKPVGADNFFETLLGALLRHS
jgi:PAS domain S-box-containing protein